MIRGFLNDGMGYVKTLETSISIVTCRLPGLVWYKVHVDRSHTDSGPRDNLLASGKIWKRGEESECLA
jgi:hypothetical protein